MARGEERAEEEAGAVEEHHHAAAPHEQELQHARCDADASAWPAFLLLPPSLPLNSLASRVGFSFSSLVGGSARVEEVSLKQNQMFRTGGFLLAIDLFACILTGAIKYARGISETSRRRQFPFSYFPSLSISLPD